MKHASRFPGEFADLLTARGRRLIAAPDALAADLTRERLIYAESLIARDRALELRALLERRMTPHLTPLARAVPPESISNQTRGQQERLIKTVRVRTAMLARRGSRAWNAAESLGVIRLLRSASLRAFAEGIAGRALDPDCGVQVLRYGAGDYAGPHTDHDPENPRAKDGYIDVHISLGGPEVRHQYLVWARDGHFSRMVDINRAGGVAVYHLPLWHHVTPLVPRRADDPAACRWVLLATYLFAPRK